MDGHIERVPVTGVVPVDQMVGDEEEDRRLLKVIAEGATKYLQSFSWCKKIRSTYFGDGYGGIIGVFLFHIEPSRKGVDEWLWVVFGDVPPAYLVIDHAKTPSKALEYYIAEVSVWVELAKQSRSSKDAIPVDLPAKPEDAARVASKLKLLEEFVLPSFQEAERVRAKRNAPLGAREG